MLTDLYNIDFESAGFTEDGWHFLLWVLALHFFGLVKAGDEDLELV